MKRSRPHANHDRWLVSYADFITLLFAFFVVLYASAEVDRHRMNQLAVAIQAGFQQMGAFTGTPQQQSPLSDRSADTSSIAPGNMVTLNIRQRDSVQEGKEREELLARLESELQKRQVPSNYVSVRESTDGVVVSLREVGFFDSGSSRIRTQAVPLFEEITSLIAGERSPLRVEGHTDDVPIHNAMFHSNWELSTARATEVIRLMVTQYGFNPQDLSAAGYAEYHPLATNDTAEGRGANRRVDIVILTRTLAFMPVSSH